MIKKRLTLLLAVMASIFGTALGTCGDSCSCEYTSRSYLWVRPHFLSQSPELISGFRDDRIRARESVFCSAFQAVAYGSKSRNWCSLARYFMPNCKRSLVADSRICRDSSGMCNVGSDPIAPVAVDKDLLAEHFNIFYTKTDADYSDGAFSSRIWFEPEQTVVGAGIQLIGDIVSFCDSDRAIWGSISFPIEYVRNRMGLHEEILMTDGSVDKRGDEKVVANMIEAFNQDEWEYGKICQGSMSRTGIADIELKLGYRWLLRDPCYVSSYVGILTPTGNKPTARYLFEPVVGNGRRWGLMFGSYGGIRVIGSDDDRAFNCRLEFAGNSMYLLSQTYCRSLDLKCRPWSRYMAVYTSEEQADQAAADLVAATTNEEERRAKNFAVSGINVFTVPVNVKGGFQSNATTSFVMTCASFQAELGYNFFCRNAECVELACPWKEGVALKCSKITAGQVNSVRDIRGRYETECNMYGCLCTDIPYSRAVISESDLNLNSAAAPLVFTQTIFGAVGYRCDTCENPLFANLGFSYEMSQSNAMLERWTIWGKVGVSF